MVCALFVSLSLSSSYFIAEADQESGTGGSGPPGAETGAALFTPADGSAVETVSETNRAEKGVIGTPVQIQDYPALSAPVLVADGTTVYTVSMTASDTDGHDDITALRVLFNHNEAGWGQEFARGYLAWGATDEAITQYGGSWVIADATGGGRWGYEAAAWGGTEYITPLGCTMSTGGQASGGTGTRTVTWTFAAKPAWAENPYTNDADAWAADSTSNTKWRDNPAEFDVIAEPCVTVSPTPRAPSVTDPTSTSLDVAIDPADPPDDLYAIRISPEMNGKKFVQADGTIGSFPVFQSASEWGTKRVMGLLWSRSYSFAARRRGNSPGSCASGYGPQTSLVTQSARYVPRLNTGARFELEDMIYHGAGQTYSEGSAQNLGFDLYTDLMGRSRAPFIFMAYASIGSSQATYDRIRTRLEGYMATDGRYIVPQIGFGIASGEKLPTESQLDALVDKIRSLNRPVFLRMGYEFNGTWYNPMYVAPYYVQSYRMVVDRLRAANLPVATLWCAYPGYDEYYGNWEYLNDFYPGDDYVDWWSIDLFVPGDLVHSNTLAFLAKAELAGKPIMIGEATPTTVGADNASDWNTWFRPFFDLIHNYPCIKGHTYINWNWAGTNWPTWGDARLETGDPVVRDGYLEEMSSPFYFNAPGDVPEVFQPVTSTLQNDGGMNSYE